jgi:hypothetical protein
MSRAAGVPLVIALLVAGTLGAPDGASASGTDEPPPYRVRHFELRDLPLDRLPWTASAPPELPATPPVDAHGIRLYRWRDGRLYYRPGSVAISGMKRLDAYRDTGDRRQLQQALVHARHLRRMAILRDDAWWLPFWFDYAPESLEAPWFNAMSQGLALSFFVRLHRITGDPQHLRAAERIFESFRRLGPERPPVNSPRRIRMPRRAWVAYVDERDHLWLEHYPVARPDHVLNAHLHATIGLYEYWQHTRSAEARQLLEGALTTMLERARQYRRRDRVSVYGLRSRTNHLHYHEIHVWQLRLLGAISGEPFFTSLGDTMAADRAPRRLVAGQPSTTSPVAVLGTARRGQRMALYPPRWSWLGRSA